MLTYELRGPVAWIGLDRPARRNAIDTALLGVLEAAARRAQGEARAMVIHGHGPCFCAGLDLGEHRVRTAEAVFDISRAWHAAFATIRRGRVPAIAAIHGAAVGGGLELAAACHLRIGDATAFFALPEGQRGIYVGGGASVHVARLIGTARMTDMMLAGRVLDAAMAERAGLLQYLEPAGGALARAEAVAAIVAAQAPLTVMAVLQALPRMQDMAEEDGLFVESLTAALVQTSAEAEARMAAFLNRKRDTAMRPPGEGRE